MHNNVMLLMLVLVILTSLLLVIFVFVNLTVCCPTRFSLGNICFYEVTMNESYLNILALGDYIVATIFLVFFFLMIAIPSFIYKIGKSIIRNIKRREK